MALVHDGCCNEGKYKKYSLRAWMREKKEEI